MKKKATILFTAFLLMNMLGLSQTNYDKNIIMHGIFLTVTDGHLNYSIDKKKLISTYDLSKNQLNASAKCENVNIVIDYINPLKMSYNVTYTNTVNPDLENVVKFFNVLTPELAKLGYNTFDKTNFSVSDYYTKLEGKAENKAPETSYYKIGFKTQELYQLAILILDHPNVYLKSSSDLSSDLHAFLKNFMSNEIDLTDIKKDIKESINLLLQADDFKKAKEEAYPKFLKQIDSLNKHLKNETDKLDEIKTIYKDFNEGSSSSDSLTKLSAYIVKNYRIYLLQQYTSKVNEEVNKIQKIIDAITALGKNFKKNLDLYDECACGNSFKIAEIPIKNEEYKDVVITINLYDLELTDEYELKVTQKSELKGKISLKPFSLLSTDFAFGLLYPFNLTYPIYSTGTNAGGQLIVSKAKNERIRFSTGAMLNLIFKTPTYPAFPLIQLGIGTGNEYPTIFTGAGIKFIKNFTITGGIMTGWYKELNNLNVGDAITGEDILKKDLQYTPILKPSFYLGAQYSF